MKLLLISLNLLMLQLAVFKAKVIGVHDGDSITVLTSDNQQMKIRLEGIDCPELKQVFGQRARQTTSALCFGKELTIWQTGKDRYGRMLAYVYVGDVCVNKELLKLGMAWHFKKYNSDSELEELENQARLQKVGLWSLNSPIPPWDYRKSH